MVVPAAGLANASHRQEELHKESLATRHYQIHRCNRQHHHHQPALAWMRRPLAQDVQQYVRTRMPEWKQQYDGVESLSLAVMGCIVNGPGESKHADIGISLPGTGEEPSAPVFIDGKKSHTLKGGNIAGEFKAIVEYYVQKRYG